MGPGRNRGGFQGPSKPYFQHQYREPKLAAQKSVFTAQNWRQIKEFEMTTSEESDDSGSEMGQPPTRIESKPAQKTDQLEKTVQQEIQKRQDLEKTLAETLKQLEEERKKSELRDRADKNQHLTPEIKVVNRSNQHSDDDRLGHVEYTRQFMAHSHSRDPPVKSTMTLLAEELERDLRLVDRTAATEVQSYVPPPDNQLALTTGARKQMADHQINLDEQREKMDSDRNQNDGNVTKCPII